jgi:hypothetical protein
VDGVMSVFVVLELSAGVVDEVRLGAHAVISVAESAQEASRSGEEGREHSSMKRERRCVAIGVAIAIVVVAMMRCLCISSISSISLYWRCYKVICTIRAVAVIVMDGKWMEDVLDVLEDGSVYAHNDNGYV